MDLRKKLQTLGFVHAGAIRPVDSGRSCRADLNLEFPGYVVFAFVVGDRIKFIGTTGTGLKKRIGGAASALKVIMENPTGHPLDPFKRLAPAVIEANLGIEVWARGSTASTYQTEKRELNLKYQPDWLGRP